MIKATAGSTSELSLHSTMAIAAQIMVLAVLPAKNTLKNSDFIMVLRIKIDLIDFLNFNFVKKIIF